MAKKKLTFAVRLAQLKPADMTVYRLAQLAGLPRQTVHRYVKGEREPTLFHAMAIAKAIDKSLADFEGCESCRTN